MMTSTPLAFTSDIPPMYTFLPIFGSPTIQTNGWKRLLLKCVHSEKSFWNS